MSKLIVIDGNSLLFRAYYATAYPGVEIMHTSTGVPTNALFAFSNMINKILSSLKEGEAIIVAFDTGKKTFRHEALDIYKANRKPAPTELVTQFPIARDFLKAMGIFQFEEDGFEGDDIAGTIARKAEQEGYKVSIYTSDRDFIQLVSDKISVNIIKKGLSDIAVMTPESVLETYGFSPKQIIDYKGLRGDSSDNLPGIPGVGDKTAVKLINTYGDFDSIVEHASEIGGKVGESIKENEKLGRLCRDLAIIKDDVDIPFSVNDTIYHGYEFDKIKSFCDQYELKQFITKLSSKWKNEDFVETRIEVEELTSLKGVQISDDIGIALDVEGDDYARADILGIALNTNGHHYFMDYPSMKKEPLLKEILKDDKKRIYCLDYKATKVLLNRHGFELNGCVFDLLLAAYLLDADAKSDYESIMQYFGVSLPKNDENSLLSFGNAPRACTIALYAQLLYQKVKKDMEKVGCFDLFNNLELPLADTLADMEIEGFPLDKNMLEEIGQTYKSKIEEVTKEIYDMVGFEFNISSPKQVGDLLFDTLKLPDYKKRSTSVDVLNDLRKYHPVVDKIIEYRKYFKLITTYIDGFKPHIFEDGKIHAKFNQALTSTGRLSSSEPNLQNISIRDEDGKIIRKAFYYPDSDYSILSLDYSQIELRILAGLSNCEPLITLFKEDKDIHSGTAKSVFHLEDEPSEIQRRKAKTVNFGIIYGISDWGLSEQLGISVKEASQIITSFYEAYPEIRDFFQNIIKEANENGYVSTILGRRRYLRELHDANYQTREFAKRAAMNAPIQGSAADLIKLAMIKVSKALKDGNYKSKMVSQIHDELIIKVHKDEKEIVYNLVKDIMEHAMDFNVPFKVDGGFGKNWYEAK